jgi:transcriptional regulator with XRE-family HTH domain
VGQDLVSQHTLQAIGAALRELREEKGLTQAELGEELGLDRPRITEIENGNRHLKAHEAGKIARALGRSKAERCAIVIALCAAGEDPTPEIER